MDVNRSKIFHFHLYPIFNQIGNTTQMYTVNPQPKKRGQAQTEYVIIVVLIAILIIPAVKMFGGSVYDLFTGSSQTLDDPNMSTGEGSNPGTEEGVAPGITEPGNNSSAGTNGTSGANRTSGTSGTSGAPGSSSGGDRDLRGSNPNNPYRFDRRTNRWYNPKTNLFVKDSEVSRFENPNQYRNR